MHLHCYIRFAIALIAIAVTSLATQSAEPNGIQSGDATDGRRISLTRSVEPSFRVEPVVQRLFGRRGETLPFSFELASTGKVMNLDIRPVNLRQEESGIILHDDQSETAEGIVFTTPTQFQLQPGEIFKIEGEVTIPLTKTNYVSFGLLVKDSGQLTKDNKNDPSDGATRAAIRFVTQYVLRVDIETGAQDIGDMDELEFDAAELVEKNGLPYVRAYLSNPTPYALESQVRATISGSDGRETAPVRLNMSSRSELPDDTKYLVRIMPASRLRLEAPIDGVLPSGEYQLNLRLSNGRRTMVQRSFPVVIDTSKFRGLRTKMLTLPGGISIHPTQLELGRVAGTNRMTTVELTNDSTQPKTIQLVPRDNSGSPISDIMLSSKKFTLKPGRSRTIRAMLKGRPTQPYQWGNIAVLAGDDESALELSLVHEARPELNLVHDELQWANLMSGNAFVMKVGNQGEGYEPLFGELKLAATTGHPMELTDGYGRWLAPGMSRELQFYVPQSVQPGSYQLILKVTTRDGTVVVERTLVLELTAEMLESNRLASR